PSDIINDSVAVNNTSMIVFGSYAGYEHYRQNGNQKPMLVRNVEVMDGVEGIISSPVWLHRINNQITDVEDRRANSLLYSPIHRAYKFIPRFLKRKPCIFSNFSAFKLDNFAHHQIESRPQVVDAVADHECGIGGNGLSELEVQKILSSVSIKLYSQAVEVGFAKEQYPFSQIVDVLVGPFDL